MFIRKNSLVSTSPAALMAATEGTETDTDTSLPNLDGEALAAKAQALGQQAGDSLTSVVNTLCDAKEEWQGGPFKVLFALQAAYGEELDSFPVPDSEDGNNPDYFKVSKTNAKGKTSLVETSFYRQFADATAAGQDILARLEAVARMGDDKAVKSDIAETYPDIYAMNPQQRKTYEGFLTGRKGTIMQAYKNAAGLHFKFIEVKNYPGVDCEPIWKEGKSPDQTDMPEVENTTRPIGVWLVPSEGKPVAKWEALSIAAFKKLNVRKATEKGGTFQALMESGVVKKAPGSGANSNNTPDDALVIKTVDTGIGVLAAVHSWTDEVEGAKDKTEYSKLLKLMNTKDNDELICAVIEVRNFLDGLAKATNADAKYIKIQSGGGELVKQVA